MIRIIRARTLAAVRQEIDATRREAGNVPALREAAAAAVRDLGRGGAQATRDRRGA